MKVVRFVDCKYSRLTIVDMFLVRHRFCGVIRLKINIIQQLYEL